MVWSPQVRRIAHEGGGADVYVVGHRLVDDIARFKLVERVELIGPVVATAYLIGLVLPTLVLLACLAAGSPLPLSSLCWW